MNQYFVVKEYQVKNAQKVLFFFPAAFTKTWHYRWTIYLLNRKGISVVGFNFTWKKAIRELNFSNLVDLIKQVDQIVDSIISKGPESVQYSVLGLSFGSVFSLYAAKRHQRIQSIILFVPYGTLSNVLWTYKPSRPFIETLMKNGLASEKELERLTQPVETQYELEKLRDRQIVSYLSKSDKIVFDGEKLVAAIKKQNIDATFYESRFGHLGTSVLGILRKSNWDQIL